MLTRDEVVWGFRYILGRDPGDEAAIGRFTDLADYEALRNALMSQPEFITRMTERLKPAPGQPFVHFERPAAVFIHLQKTAGTSLTTILLRNYKPARRCPERFNNLQRYSAAELAPYDVYSGHFDLFSTHLIPRRRVFRFSMFRRPADRLISFYRFARAHLPRPSLLADPLFRYAKECSAEAYFELEEVRRSRWINNHYRAAFSGSLSPMQTLPADAAPGTRPLEGTLAEAVAKVRTLDGIGLTAHYEESVEMIFAALNLPIPQAQERLMSTDRMPVPVPVVEMTPRLERALHDLVVEDDVIFGAACDEFDKRRARKGVI